MSTLFRTNSTATETQRTRIRNNVEMVRMYPYSYKQFRCTIQWTLVVSRVHVEMWIPVEEEPDPADGQHVRDVSQNTFHGVPFESVNTLKIISSL